MKFLDVFSGIGGFRVGMEKAGFECAGHIEIDKFANQSYNAIHNVKEDEYVGEGITTINEKELPDFDILCAGFPCQAFSVAGKQRGFEDNRATLIFQLLRIIEEKKPTILFLENVPNLLRHNKGRTFGRVLYELGKLGYDIEWQLLNTKDGWGGQWLPQSRDRLFIIGHFRGRTRGKIFPIENPNEKLSSESKIKVIGTCKIPTTMSHCRTCDIYDENGLAGTLTANAYKDPAKVKQTINGKTILRKLTPKEYFRLQGFTDEQFERAKNSGVSNAQLYKQAGNSVSTNIICEIANRLMKII